MRIFLFSILITIFSFSISQGFGKDVQGCGSDCKSCHKITKKEATKILHLIDPNVAVEDVVYSQLKGLYEVVLKKDGKSSIVYLDYAKNHIVLGRVIDIKGKKDLTRESIDKYNKIDVSKISVKNAIVMGNPQGKKKIYVFSDPECPFCTKLHDELNLLVKEDPQIKIYIILFALPMHKDAGWKTQSIICESKKNMPNALKMLEDSYHKININKKDCGKENYAEENKKMAEQLGIGATPTIVFSNGSIVMGAVSKNEIKNKLNQK